MDNDITTPRRILAIHAHPDDVEIFAGGTLAMLAQLGHKVTIATMTAGDCGSRQYGPDEIAKIRQREAAASANLIGADYVYAGFFDMAVFNDDASRRKVTELLRLVQPEIVITSSPVDYHADHEATSVLVRDACFSAPAPNYQSGTAKPMPDIPHLYFMDPAEGVDREGRPVEPDFFVNVKDTFAIKCDMLARHESQRLWLQQHHHMDNYIEEMEKWTRGRGRMVGVELAEGFRRYVCHPYPQSALLEQILGSIVIRKA